MKEQRSKSLSLRKRWGYRFLKQHEIQWLVSNETLRAQISMSLLDRCQHFQREFPLAKINATLLREVYRRHGIKKKKIRWTKTAKEYDPALAQRQLITMKRLLTRARNDGFRLVYIDETMFTRKTCPDMEWARQKENVRVDTAKLEEPTLALLSGISKERGLEHHQVFERSVNVDKFKTYCQDLRAANGGEKICLFMDNLSTHTSERSKAEMKRLGFRWIYNVPYEPE